MSPENKTLATVASPFDVQGLSVSTFQLLLLLMCRLLGAFTEFSIESKTEEDQNGAGPLQRTHGVAKQKNRAEDGEELPCGCDDGAGQGSKVDHSQENEGLS